MSKSALLITGRPVRNSNITHTETYQGLLRCFPKDKYDYYFQTRENNKEWKTYFHENQIEGPCYLYPEPIPYNSFINYGKKHSDIPDQSFNPNYRPLQWFIFGDKYSTDPYVIHKHNQIVGTALLIDEIEKRVPKLYDSYVRTRWDLILDNQYTDWDYYNENVKRKPRNLFGFESPKPAGKIGTRHFAVQHRFHDDSMSDYYLPDLVIFFNRTAMNAQLVLDVNARGNIVAAEWGWGQALKYLSPLDTNIYMFESSDVFVARHMNEDPKYALRNNIK